MVKLNSLQKTCCTGVETSNSQYNAMRSGLRGAKAVGMSLMFVASPISETATPVVTNAPLFSREQIMMDFYVLPEVKVQKGI